MLPSPCNLDAGKRISFFNVQDDSSLIWLKSELNQIVLRPESGTDPLHPHNYHFHILILFSFFFFSFTMILLKCIHLSFTPKVHISYWRWLGRWWFYWYPLNIIQCLGFLVQISAGAFLCGGCMFSLCMRGFSLDTMASSQSPKTCMSSRCMVVCLCVVPVKLLPYGSYHRFQPYLTLYCIK